jgi:hypothetical protein
MTLFRQHSTFPFFRHRLGLGCWLSLSWRSISAFILKKLSKECNDWAKESLSLLHDSSHFVISFFDFNKSFFGLLVKLTPFLDSRNASIGGKEDADRINFLLRQAVRCHM